MILQHLFKGGLKCGIYFRKYDTYIIIKPLFHEQGSIEEKIYQRQICKSGLAEIMESGGSSQATVKFSREELKVSN